MAESHAEDTHTSCPTYRYCSVPNPVTVSRQGGFHWGFSSATQHSHLCAWSRGTAETRLLPCVKTGTKVLASPGRPLRGGLLVFHCHFH